MPGELDDRLRDLGWEAFELADDGKKSEAEALLREGLVLFEKCVDPPEETCRHAMDLERSLSELLIERGALDEAEKRLHRVLEHPAGERIEDALETRELMAELEIARKRPVVAERWKRETLQLARDGGKSMRGRALSALESLETFVAEQGRRGEAIALHTEAAQERLAIGLAFYLDRDLPVSADDVRLLSYGRVESGATLEAGGKPVPGGLRCSKIFGPVRDHECYCGKYRGADHAGIVCELCGVEVIASSVRAERLGHINPVSPLLHPLFKQNVTSRMRKSESELLRLEGLDTEWRSAWIDGGGTPPEHSGMIVECVPVLPPDGALPVSREALEPAWAALIDAKDPIAAQRALDRLFTLVQNSTRTPM